LVTSTTKEEVSCVTGAKSPRRVERKFLVEAGLIAKPCVVMSKV